MSSGKIVKVSGPLVVATGLSDANMADVVRVGEQRLIGEILTMNGDSASIQVYEETSGLGPGAAVETTGSPLSVELGPGLIENIYDGIQRPLEGIMKIAGSTITRGIEVPALDRQKHWDFQATAKPGDKQIHLRAERGSTVNGICSNPFLEKNFQTTSWDVTFTFNDDGTITYEEDTVLVIPGVPKEFHHTDKNTLKMIAAPRPNPMMVEEGLCNRNPK